MIATPPRPSFLTRVRPPATPNPQIVNRTISDPGVLRRRAQQDAILANDRAASRPAPAPGIVTRVPPAPQTMRDSAVSVRPGPSSSPNLGGTITRGGVTRAYAPSPANPAPFKSAAAPMNDNDEDDAPTGTTPMQPRMPQSPAAPPAGGNAALPAQPPVIPPAQSEAANPLTGAATTQPPGTTAATLGFSSRGNATPPGTDAAADPLMGGSGPWARRFRTPEAASMYSDYVRNLFQ